MDPKNAARKELARRELDRRTRPRSAGEIAAEIKAERGPNPTRKFNITDLSLPGAIIRGIEALDTLKPGEASISAAMGRGMQDVYQGTGQLGKHVGKELSNNPQSFLSKALKTSPVTAALSAYLGGTYQQGDAEKTDKVLKEELALYEKNNPDFQPARLVGNAATPLALIPGGGNTLAAKTALSTVTGALGGASQPVTGGDFWRTKGIQTGTGMAIGAAIPGTAKAGGWMATKAKHFYDLLVNPKYANDIKEGLFKILGPNREKVLNALKNAKDGETAGQAIARANRGKPERFGSSVVKLEKEISRDPQLGDKVKTIYDKQIAGRKKVVEALGGTDDNISRLKARRAARTEPLYKAVETSKAKVDTKPVISKLDNILDKSKNESDVTTPLSSLRQKLFDGDNLDTSPKNLSSLSKEIGKMMSKTADGQKVYSQSALREIKSALDDQISKADKAYRTALNVHKGMSNPVDRAKVGKVLREALESPLEKEKAHAFTTAIEKGPDTVKKATGFKKGSLEKTLTQDQMESVKKVADELSTIAKADEMSSKTGGLLRGISAEEGVGLPRILSRPVVIANALLSKVGKGHSEEYRKVLAEVISDPKALEKMLTLTPDDPKRKMAMDIARQLTTLTSSQTTARGQNDVQ